MHNVINMYRNDSCRDTDAGDGYVLPWHALAI